MKAKIIAVITGDIVNSREVESSEWLPILKNTLKRFGKEPQDWEIYRGDSFQLKMNVEEALIFAFLVKAAIKQNKELDVRLAIGIGTSLHKADRITEANGEAFINSGECFENLKLARLAIRSPWKDFDQMFNILLDTMALCSDSWSVVSSECIQQILVESTKNQSEIAAILGKSQASVSEALKRAGNDELQKILSYYQTQTVKYA